MPMYEYLCESCDERIEVFKKVSERDQEEQCPNCGEPAHRILSGFAISGGGGGGGGSYRSSGSSSGGCFSGG